MSSPGGRPPRGAFERALRFCRARRLFAPGERVLVGSGSGAASLGALGFLRLAQKELRLAEVVVAAVDLGREDDAEAVADVGRFARLLGTTFHALSADDGRPLPALQALARREGITRIALGHTRDDAVARVLAAIARGRDVTAVRPLLARRRDGVVRPLLELRDAEALELARTAGIEPPMLVPDPHGAHHTPATLEQRLRAGVLPRLRVEVAGADHALLAHAHAVAKLVREVRREARSRLDAVHPLPAGIAGSGVVALPCVAPDQSALAAALAREALSRVGATTVVARTAVDPLARLITSAPGATAVTPRGIGATNPREVVLGPGVVATYLPDLRVVALRVLRAPRRASDEVSG